MADISALVKRRGTLKGRLTTFISYLQAFNQARDDLMALRVRLEKIEAMWSDFEDIQTSIEESDSSEEQTKERSDFETRYYETVAYARNVIQSRTVTAAATNNTNSNGASEHSSNVKLPPLDLPDFDGNYGHWVAFYDSFHSLIHTNTTLTEVQKFHYLKSCLKGIAAQSVSSLKTTASNYTIAWDILKERFEDTRLITNHHIQAILDFPPIVKESAVSLRHLYDTMNRNIRALTSLGEPTEHWDSLLIYIITTKLDAATKREWEEEISKTKLPKMTDLTNFLKEQCKILESVHVSKLTNKLAGASLECKTRTGRRNEHSFTYVTTNDKPTCPVCKQPHMIYHCDKFRSFSAQARFNEIKKRKLCINCLRSNHTFQNCTSGNCLRCNRKHHTLLHWDNEQTTQNASGTSERTNNSASIQNNEGNTPTQTQSKVSVSLSNQSVGARSQVILSTVLVNVSDNQGRIHACRAVLDSCSQSNFITNELCEKLNLTKRQTVVTVTGITQGNLKIPNSTTATIKSRFNGYQRTLSFLVIREITNMSPPTDLHEFKIPKNVKLADPVFCKAGKIELLLGGEIFLELLCAGQIRQDKNSPILQKTTLGWIVGGPWFAKESHCESTTSLLCSSNEDELHKKLENFWTIEEGPHEQHRSLEEQACEELFIKEHRRAKDGRFIVTLPFCGNPQQLGDSKMMAKERLRSVEQKLRRSTDLKQAYTKFLEEYEQLGHMTRITDETTNSFQYYLPHHDVIKESSTTTRVRVVFDASAKTTTGLSLNDLLMVGPTIQQDLCAIVIRFRQHKYVVTADISKMYRQIWLQEDQRDLQRIVWRPNPVEPIQTFRLNTVTYGLSSAPFLAIRCLHQLAVENQEQFPEASDVITRDFYVDDLLTGGSTISHVSKIKNEIQDILSKGGFTLCKWSSNDARLLVSTTDNRNALHDICNEESKTLGLIWESRTDVLRYKVKTWNNASSITKRSILSMISTIFDPLGLVAPVVVKAKILLQKLWQLKIGWDQSIPLDLFTSWQGYAKQLQQLTNINIPRHVLCEEPISIEIHGFCDASEAAYGACLYLRSVSSSGLTETYLLFAKSRIAPLKHVTIPRLELCGAKLLAELYGFIKRTLAIKVSQAYLWSDSSVALAWIRGQPANWKTFVANRVAKIQQETQSATWGHVKSDENPADLLSRGSDPLSIQQSQLWWHGPHWLSQEARYWPINLETSVNEIPDQKLTTITLMTNVNHNTVFQRFSSLSRLKRTVAYILRFRNNALHREARLTSFLTVDELNNALKILVKLAQEEEFALELDGLRKGKPINLKSSLLSLNPFLDQHGIVRVGGRISQATLTYDQKHPMLLPAKHKLTELIIRDEHLRLLHMGPQALLASIRTRYWPLSGRHTVRRVLRKCVVCFRANPRSLSQLMGDLPKTRLVANRPFLNTGIDFAGPFKIKVSRNKSAKAYLCVFVCFTSKAIHLEIVSDLSTNPFLNALDRFTARRGICQNIYTDNGSNFVGASNELRAVYEFLSNESNRTLIGDSLSTRRIRWHFIPPYSPHMGGIWEAAVKSAKVHMKKVIGDTLLSFEELYTVMTRIEACLNSRPICPLSSDPSEFNALTPGHFIIGESMTAIPQIDLLDVPGNKLNRYQLLIQMKQHFWARWSVEYIAQLQQRTKWMTTEPNRLQPNTLVIIKDKALPPMRWRLGRIIEVHPGNDGLIRTASIQTSEGTIKRSLPQICILPTEPEAKIGCDS